MAVEDKGPLAGLPIVRMRSPTYNTLLYWKILQTSNYTGLQSFGYFSGILRAGDILSPNPQRPALLERFLGGLSRSETSQDLCACRLGFGFRVGLSFSRFRSPESAFRV